MTGASELTRAGIFVWGVAGIAALALGARRGLSERLDTPTSGSWLDTIGVDDLLRVCTCGGSVRTGSRGVACEEKVVCTVLKA